MLYNVAKRLELRVPGSPFPLCQDAVVKALGAIYDQCDWSMQKGYAAWLAPGVVFQNGTFTTTPYTNTVIADATATALIQGYTGNPLLTQLQYRNPAYEVYNIVAVDPGTTPGYMNYPYATLTLDRPWMDPTSGPGQPYMIYQVYFAAPVSDFRKFIEIRDPVNDNYLDFWSKTQADLAIQDPQRLDFSNPRFAVPAGMDQRPGSATYGWQLFELWPHQGNYVPYPFSYRRRGPLPQQQSDWYSMSAPYPITDELVEWRARTLLCQDREAQKDVTAPKGAGANWLLLSQMAEKQYNYLLGEAIAIDLNLDGEHLTNTKLRGPWSGGAPYATMMGGINLGGYSGN